MIRAGRPRATAPFPVASLDPERRLAAARRRLDNGQGLSDEMRARVLAANAAALREQPERIIEVGGACAELLEREDGLFGVARYAKQVMIYEGESTEEEMLTRLFGQRPSLLVKWEDDQVTPRSNRPGCLYVTQQRFSVLCVAQNNRPDWQALQGSTLPDPSEGPGLNRMIGDVRYVLAGAQLGLGNALQFAAPHGGVVAGQGMGSLGADARQGAGEVLFMVVDHAIGVGAVAFGVAVAGDDQVVAQRPGQGVQVGDQRLPVPVQKAFVLAAHALAAAAGQEQDGAVGEGVARGAWRVHGGALAGVCGITPACFHLNRIAS